MIDVAIFDKHQLLLESFTAYISGVSDFRIVLSCNDRQVLNEKLKNIQPNILILTMHDISVRDLNFIVQLNISQPKLKILIVSVIDSEEIVLKAIKSGAKGFLGKDSGRDNLLEAIYTLRNGHDYFSESITHLLLNRYIRNLNSDEMSQNGDLSNLSSRQVEILKLWGESYSNQEIADRFFISIRTVESHKNHIMQKLNLKSTVDMVKYAIKNNIIEI